MDQTLTNRLTRILQIRSGEGSLALSISALFFVLYAGIAFGLRIAETLFNQRVGVNQLSTMFIILGGVNILVSLFYSAGLARFHKGWYFSILILGLCGIVLFEKNLIPSQSAGDTRLFSIIWITASVIQTLLTTIAWAIAGDATNTRQAKRLFSLFGSASTLGLVFGSGTASLLAANYHAHIENGLTWQIGFLVVGMALVWWNAKYLEPVDASHPLTDWEAIKVGYNVVVKSPLLRLVALTAVLTVILFLAVHIPFNDITTAAYQGDEAGYLAFLGTFNGIVTTITLLVSLLLANRLTEKIGVVNLGFILVGAYLVGLSLLALDSHSVPFAITAKALQTIALDGIYLSSSMIFFNIAPPEKRAQANVFINGIVMQVGLILSGGLQILGKDFLSQENILVGGMVIALVTGVIFYFTRSGYKNALLDALRAGRIEVFSSDPEGAANLQIPLDSNAIQVAFDGLLDERPMVRKLSIEMLGNMQDVESLSKIMLLINDPDPEVQIAVIEALSQNRVIISETKALELLNASETEVQLAAIKHLPDLLSDPSAKVLGKLKDTLRADILEVQITSAITLTKLGLLKEALDAMVRLAKNKNAQTKAFGFQSIGKIAALYNEFASSPLTARFDPNLIFAGLKDKTAIIRQTASETAGVIGDDQFIDALVELLRDHDECVRLAAAEALRAFGEKSEAKVLTVLKQDHHLAQEAVLSALSPGDEHIQETLIDFIRGEVEVLKTWRKQGLAVSLPGRASELLQDVIQENALRSEVRLVKAFALFNPESAQSLKIVIEGIRSPDEETRAAAIETLDTLSENETAKDLILPILEDASSDQIYQEQETHLDPIGAITELFALEDEWVQALAASVAGELRLTQLIPDLKRLKKHGTPFVKETVYTVLVRLEKDKTMSRKTLKTLSSLERIILLQEVPLFKDLPVEDLRPIAELAEEEIFSKGEFLLKQGKHGNDLYIIVDGQVEIRVESEKEQSVVASYTTGGFFGEMAILESTLRSASAVAVEDTRVLVINGDPFKAILRDRPEVSLAVIINMSRRVREMNRILAELN